MHFKSAVPGKHVKAERARGKGLCGCRAVKPVGFYSRNQWAKADSERKWSGSCSWIVGATDQQLPEEIHKRTCSSFELSSTSDAGSTISLT